MKYVNVKRNHIYVRPNAARHHLVLADDLTRDALERMRHDGVAPVLVVETSPANYQAWISVAEDSRKIVPPDIRGAIARRLSGEYRSDPGSAGVHHYGPLRHSTSE